MRRTNLLLVAAALVPAVYAFTGTITWLRIVSAVIVVADLVALVILNGKHRTLGLLMLFAAVTGLTAGCLPADQSQYSPPIVQVLQFGQGPGKCALYVLATGGTVLGTAIDPPAGAVAIMVWTSTGIGFMGTVDTCWEEYHNSSYLLGVVSCDPTSGGTLYAIDNWGRWTAYIKTLNCFLPGGGGGGGGGGGMGW